MLALYFTKTQSNTNSAPKNHAFTEFSKRCITDTMEAENINVTYVKAHQCSISLKHCHLVIKIMRTQIFIKVYIFKERALCHNGVEYIVVRQSIGSINWARFVSVARTTDLFDGSGNPLFPWDQSSANLTISETTTLGDVSSLSGVATFNNQIKITINTNNSFSKTNYQDKYNFNVISTFNSRMTLSKEYVIQLGQNNIVYQNTRYIPY
jgi:hypothetical protein